MSDEQPPEANPAPTTPAETAQATSPEPKASPEAQARLEELEAQKATAGEITDPAARKRELRKLRKQIRNLKKDQGIYQPRVRGTGLSKKKRRRKNRYSPPSHSYTPEEREFFLEGLQEGYKNLGVQALNEYSQTEHSSATLEKFEAALAYSLTLSMDYAKEQSIGPSQVAVTQFKRFETRWNFSPKQYDLELTGGDTLIMLGPIPKTHPTTGRAVRPS